MQGKTNEELKNNTNIHIEKDKGRTKKQKPYFTKGKTREELKNITHIHRGKDKGGTEKQKPYQ